MRHSWATFMRKNGIAISRANRCGIKPYTQIRAQILGQKGQYMTQPDATIEGTKSEKSPVNDRACLGLAPLVAEMKVERAKGFESTVGVSVHAARCKQVPFKVR